MAPTLRIHLDDVLGELRYARRSGDLGRMALLAYCEVRRWARRAGEEAIAARSFELAARSPCGSRSEFLAIVDGLIVDLESVRQRVADRVDVPVPALPIARPVVSD